MDTDKKTRMEKLHAEIEKYESTLKAFVGLEYILCTLENVSIDQGKKLYIDDGSAPRGRQVTPDMVIESKSTKRPYRGINEIKWSLPARAENWDKIVAQLEKYRLVTGGWSNPPPGVDHDVMLTTERSKAKQFASLACRTGASPDMKEWLIVIGVAVVKRDDGEFMEIAKVCGKIGNAKIDKGMPLTKPYQILMQKIVRELDQMKFYDSYPPVAYTMAILWDHVFSKFVHGKKLRDLRNNKKVKIATTAAQIQNTIDAFAPRTNAGCIRQSRIEDALKKFEDMHVISRQDDGLIVITYKKAPVTTTDWIISRIAGLPQGHSPRAPP